jgi:hypothetical protein
MASDHHDSAVEPKLLSRSQREKLLSLYDEINENGITSKLAELLKDRIRSALVSDYLQEANSTLLSIFWEYPRDDYT